MTFWKKRKRWIVIAAVALFLYGALLVGKGIFLNRVRVQLQTVFHYDTLRMTVLPPSIIVEDVRSLSTAPFYSIRKIVVSMSSLSLFRRDKPLRIVVDNPVLRLTWPARPSDGPGRSLSLLPLPFDIEKGLIRNGEAFIWSESGYLQSRNIQLLFTQKEDAFSLKVDASTNTFHPSSAVETLEGRILLAVSGKGQEILVHRILAETNGFIFKADGRVTNPGDPRIELSTFFNADTILLAELLDMPFEWEGRARGEGRIERAEGRVRFTTAVRSNNLVLNDVAMGDVDGRVDWDSTDGAKVELRTRKTGDPPGFVSLEFSDEGVRGSARSVPLNTIMNYARVPWPVRSPAWGTFLLQNRVLDVSAEFRDTSTGPDGNGYPFMGRVRFRYDFDTNNLEADSRDLISSFARVEAEARVRIDETLDIEIRGEVADVAQTRQFVSLLLDQSFPIPEIRGRGTADVEILGDYKNPRIQMTFDLSPAGFDLFNAASVSGRVVIAGDHLDGSFRMDDPDMKGLLALTVRGDRLETDIRLDEGRAEVILPSLAIDAPVEGRAAGRFFYMQQGDEEQVSGVFSSRSLSVLGQEIRDVSSGLQWKDGRLAFPSINLTLHEGPVRGHAAVGLDDLSYDVDLRAESVDLSGFSSDLHGRGQIRLQGVGRFGREGLTGRFDISDLHVEPLQPAQAEGSVILDIIENGLLIEIDGGFLPGSNAIRSTIRIPLDESTIQADIRGHYENLDLLLPWPGAKGRLNHIFEVHGLRAAPVVDGVVDFKGALIPFPGFAHAVTDYTGLVFVQKGNISVRSFQGYLGGGEVRASGNIAIGSGGIERIDLTADGGDMLLSPLERTRALADGTVRLLKDDRRFVLEGGFTVKKLSWRREALERIAFSSAPYPSVKREAGFFDDLNLNLRFRSDGNAWMENALGRVHGRFDLTVSGNILDPLVLGEIETLGGEIFFQDRKFKLLQGRLNFFNPAAIEPFLEFRAESYVKDYRVTMAVSGLVSNLRPEFTSSPPLPPEDVLALLAMGEAFKRTYQYDVSSQLGTTSLLSFQLTEEAKKRAESLFSLDRFRIDPFIMGTSAEMTARLTVGKQVSRSLFILYSTNLNTQREEIVRMEWEIGNDFSIVGIRNEWGRISFDVKVRKRF
ncbi:MAG: translocation/assembly module TamB domain-containing protein [Acidobacteriota bacterium]|nr:translocation/assembly module TamB domain-containing protein [Acidobacteriota bacterium]